MQPTTAIDVPTRRRVDRTVVVSSLVVIVAALLAAFTRSSGRGHATWLLPLVAAGGLGLAWLAIRRFALFVAAILFLRASLDALKIAPQTSALLDPAALLSGAFVVVGGIWLLVQPKEERAPRSPLVAPLTLLAGVGALSTLSAPNAALGITDVAKLATVVVMLAVLNQVFRDEQDTKIVLGAALASAVIPLVVAALNGVLGFGLHYSGSFTRIEATFTHPNPFAIYLCSTIVMAAALFRYVRTLTQVALFLLITGCSVALFFTYTRSAWISTVLGLVVVGAFLSRRLIVALGVAVVLVVVLVPGISERFSDLNTTLTQSGAAGNSLVWRFGYWRQALELNDDPLLGTGLSAVRTEGSEAKEPHNDFIRSYVETGILGFMAYLWFLWRAGGVARRGIRETDDGFWRGVAVGFAGVLAAFVVLSVVSNVITQLVVLWYVGTFATATIAAPRLAPRIDALDVEPVPA
jgi:O-antigen ligase